MEYSVSRASRLAQHGRLKKIARRHDISVRHRLALLAERVFSPILHLVRGPFPPADTAPDAWNKQFELYRRMSPAEKAAGVRAITLAVNALALAGLRQQYPAATEAELQLRLAVRRLGEELVARAYGWRPPGHGA